MRIVVFSDSHGNYWVLKKIVERYRSRPPFLSTWEIWSGMWSLCGPCVPASKFWGCRATATCFPPLPAMIW